MPDAQVTLTLPLTQAGAQVLLAALGIALATGLVYLMLAAQGRKPRSDPAMDWLKALGVALVPVWLILLGGTLWHLWLLFDGQASVLGDTGFGMGAVIAAFLGGPFVIWGTVIKQETVKYQKEGHITERISKAVEQLGEEKTVKRDSGDVTVPNIEVRIGGLLSLERIAQDSTQNDKGRDHVRVMEILCAYVRENAPASEARDFPLPDWEPLPDDATEEARAAHEAWREARLGDPSYPFRQYPNAPEWAQSLPGPRADIALALQIIGRRSPDQRQVEARWGQTAAADAAWVFDMPCPELPDPESDAPHGTETLDAFTAKLDAWKAQIDGYAGYRLDLRGTNLQGADLSGLMLSGASLSAARMEGATLPEARMEGTKLMKARMDGADLRNARMEGAKLMKAHMEGALFGEARLDGADLCGAQMAGADFSAARMAGSDLGRARMESANLLAARTEGAIFYEAVMDGAELSRARMEVVGLSEARMVGACFRETQMEGSDLSGADMTDANLSAARMKGTDLNGAQMERANLYEACLQSADFYMAQFSKTTLVRWTELQAAALKNVNLSMLDLTQAQINVTFGDASATLPDGLTRPEHWPEWELSPFKGDHAFHYEWRKWRADPDGYTPPPPPED